MEQRLIYFAQSMKFRKIRFERLSRMEWLSLNVAPDLFAIDGVVVATLCR